VKKQLAELLVLRAGEPRNPVVVVLLDWREFMNQINII